MMARPMLTEIPYHPDSAALFDAVACWPWAVFLDCGRPFVEQGRYDIIAADPMLVVTTRGGLTRVQRGSGTKVSSADPFAVLRNCLGEPGESLNGLPFSGGALGYFSYDLGRRIECLPQQAEDAEQIPEMAVGVYDWALVVDHRERRSFLVSQGRDRRTTLRWADLLSRFRRAGPGRRHQRFRVLEPPQSNFDFEQYADAFHRIKYYIGRGDCYQVNLAQRFDTRVEGSLWQAYRTLRERNPAPFSAYMNTPYCQVLSCSPERFLRANDGVVETRPIKGTRPRSLHPDQDRRLAQELQRSAKDRAENVMIVDLMRNDLGKVCTPGTIRVPALFEVESFATVHHLVSTVSGELDAGRDSLDLLRACFPGGSITGAPKLRAMEIIEEL
ncbi:MAG TPA: anthranilate synthase component I family protein, partial [Gammaproteobacteria bacterium]|nr:anthranilate synthase component I family protein [Gammaproteobacteria bacterium]